MSPIELLKKQIEIIKRLIRLYQLLIAIEKNKPAPPLEEIKNCIKETAKKYGISEKLALAVAQAESNFDPFAINFNDTDSIDRGLYQWNDKWHPEVTDEMAFNYKISTELFCKAVREGNLYWWNSLRHIWSKLIS